jgi:Uma2 family endonuclease
MKQIVETPPRTMMELYKTLPQGTLAELINNQLYMSPSPVYNHQDVLIEIASQLRMHLKKSGGKVAIAPFDVYLDETGNAVQPDIVVVLNNNKGTLHPNGHFHGVPDVLVEILSPSNRDHDLVLKKGLYERFGVKEYWIVDPETKLTTIFERVNQQYEIVAERKAVLESKLLEIIIQF